MVMFELLLIPFFALVFALLHVVSVKLLDFAEISPHVTLIYLPAFSRLLHVLLLGKFRGTLATALGGMLLMQSVDGINLFGFMNVACSVSGPLIAIWMFERIHGVTLMGYVRRQLRPLRKIFNGIVGK